jgi:hypothetical protein
MKATAVCVLACLLAVDAASLRGAAEAENQERALLGKTYCPATPFLTSVSPVMKRVGDNGWRLQAIVSSGDDVGGYKLPRNPVSCTMCLLLHVASKSRTHALQKICMLAIACTDDAWDVLSSWC